MTNYQDYKAIEPFGDNGGVPLTNAYQYSVVVGSAGAAEGEAVVNFAQGNQIVIYAFYDKNTSSSMEIVIEFSFDGVNWIQESIEQTNTGSGTVDLFPLEYTLASAGTYRIATPAKDRYMRIGYKCTGLEGDFGGGLIIVGTV